MPWDGSQPNMAENSCTSSSATQNSGNATPTISQDLPITGMVSVLLTVGLTNRVS